MRYACGVLICSALAACGTVSASGCSSISHPISPGLLSYYIGQSYHRQGAGEERDSNPADGCGYCRTSVTWSRSSLGNVMPSSRAVLWLTTKSKRIGCPIISAAGSIQRVWPVRLALFTASASGPTRPGAQRATGTLTSKGPWAYAQGPQRTCVGGRRGSVRLCAVSAAPQAAQTYESTKCD